MKDCEHALMYFGKCCERSDGECIILDNDTVPGGKIQPGLIVDTYREFSTEVLRAAAKSLSPGGSLGDVCKAAPTIVGAITLVLRERGESL